MTRNWLGLLSIGVFYVMVLATGIWASRKSKREERKCTENRSEVAMVGRRNLNIWVSIFTMTATWVGGGYIMANASLVYNPTKGLVWALVSPIGFSLTMILGGLFFVGPVRSKEYVTIMDPFQKKYGNTVTAIIFIPSLLADIFWIACILGILGGTISIVMDISSWLAVVISAAVAIIYTLMGGLYSVAYTDVIQLCLIFIGLWLCVPFVLMSPYSTNATVTAVTQLSQQPWMGRLEVEDAGRWIDDLLLMAIGGICYQAFYQRVLSSASVTQGKVMCFSAAVLCPIFAIPSLIIGGVAASTNWNQTSYGSPSPHERGQTGMILPIALQHLCPYFISVAGVGALAASVMSSVDSALLSAASMLGRNVFKNIIYKKASEKCILVVVKVSVLLCGIIGTCLALVSTSIHLFWIISTDVMYSMMTPQVICTLFLPQRVNHYGACSGFVVAMVLRALVGEPLLSLPDVLPLPWDKVKEDGHLQRLFPFCTAIMFITTATILGVSAFSMWLSEKMQRKRSADSVADTGLQEIPPVQKSLLKDESG